MFEKQLNRFRFLYIRMSDPYAGTTTRNVLQHIISPKIVGPTGGTYSVKTDLVNVDNVYASGLIRAGTSGSGDVQSSTAFSIYNPSNSNEIYARITALPTTVYIQGTQQIRFTTLLQSGSNTLISLGTPGNNNDTLIVGGDIQVTNSTYRQYSITYNGITDYTNGNVFDHISSQVGAGSGTFTFTFLNSGAYYGVSFNWTKVGIATQNVTTENQATLTWDGGSGNFTIKVNDSSLNGLPYKAVLTVTTIQS